MNRLMFTKMVQVCGWEEVAAHAKRLGFDGLDLTCRGEGHVLPENVREDLPRAIELFQKHGLEVPMITSGITTGEEPYARDVMETAGRCGVKYVKLGYWWMGDEYGNALKRFGDAMRAMEKIERLAKDAGVCAMIHTHSGSCVSAIPMFIRQLLEGRDVNHVGAYIDPGHMVVEGGNAGWQIGLELLAPYIKMVAVKNMIWVSQQQENYVEWQCRTTPLAEGIVAWPKILEILKKIGYDGYITVHSEYLDEYSWRVLNLQECLDQTVKDLRYLDSINFR